mmetsp:Transcript_53288/g.125085  ORF Transcript_53288/g.125085 Transcript_53288/m.125085 type:complete len:261 (-) Transcript_53288:235-1017(-)
MAPRTALRPGALDTEFRQPLARHGHMPGAKLVCQSARDMRQDQGCADMVLLQMQRMRLVEGRAGECKRTAGAEDVCPRIQPQRALAGLGLEAVEQLPGLVDARLGLGQSTELALCTGLIDPEGGGGVGVLRGRRQTGQQRLSDAHRSTEMSIVPQQAGPTAAGDQDIGARNGGRRVLGLGGAAGQLGVLDRCTRLPGARMHHREGFIRGLDGGQPPLRLCQPKGLAGRRCSFISLAAVGRRHRMGQQRIEPGRLHPGVGS